MNCRQCQHNNLTLIHDFGRLPLANFLTNTDRELASLYPLRFYMCSECLLGQTEDQVIPQEIFSDYRYTTSSSLTFLTHIKEFINSAERENRVSKADYVLEIASNDGYLLELLDKRGFKVLGVEPAKNIANIAKRKNLNIINDFFTTGLAEDIFKTYGYPSLIVANNVLAHVPDILDFMRGISKLVGPKTWVSIENPSIMGILKGNQFDTIYHEHFSYLSVTSVHNLCQLTNLKLVDVSRVNIHGASNRYWIRSIDTPERSQSNSVSQLMDEEIFLGLNDAEVWRQASLNFTRAMQDFRDFIEDAESPTFGFGAAAKASTLINASKISSGKIAAIADNSSEKQGRFLPTSSIPIISPNELISSEAKRIIIFPWNIKEELMKQLKSLGLGKIPQYILIPQLTKVS